MNSPYKWRLFYLWYFYLPITTFIYGYAKTQRVNMGEDLPKGVAVQWKNWRINKKYFGNDFKRLGTPLYFDKVKIPIKLIQISDDPIANDITIAKPVKYYSKAKIIVQRICPPDLNVSKIGQTGLFSRKFKKTLQVKFPE